MRPVTERIRTVEDARRCIRAICSYLKRHEATMAAEDLKRAIQVLIKAASQ